MVKCCKSCKYRLRLAVVRIRYTRVTGMEFSGDVDVQTAVYCVLTLGYSGGREPRYENGIAE